MMRSKLLLLFAGLLLTPLIAQAQERPSSQVVAQDRARATDVMKAAYNSAVEKLADDIGQMQLAQGVTVGRFIQILEQRDQFLKELSRADQIGAPRWVDNYTCQVQLEISTAQVKTALVRIASAHPKATPVSALQIQRVVARWPHQFIATGSATSHKIIRFLPSENVAWRAVSDAARQQALAAAKTDATFKACDSVKTVVLGDSKTIGQGLEIPEVNQAVYSWLSQRPVTRVDFKDDLQVEVSLGVDEHDFFNVMRNALVANKRKIDVPKTDEGWDKVEQEFSTHLRPAIGIAKAGGAGVASRGAAMHLPSSAPEWATQRISVEGQATGAGPKLRTRADAERDAVGKLQTRMENLKLGTTTIGDAAKQDARVAKAVQDALANVEVNKTEYRDGSVIVHMTADMRDLWDALRRAMP